MADDTEYFTMVFKGNIKSFEGNPFKTDTPFGRPCAVSIGDALEKVAELEEQIDLRDSAAEDRRWY